MTGAVDTSAEAVDRLAKRCDDWLSAGRKSVIAATLRVLAAERDKIAASRKALDDALTDATRSFIAERDALAAEVARLREALRSISETRWDMAAPEACLVMATTIANAALATNAKDPTP